MTGLWEDQFADRTHALKPSAIRAMAKHLGSPGVISFAAGAPFAGLFPFAATAAAMAEIMADPVLRVQALQYGPSEGYAPLRAFIATYLHADITADEVLVTSGSQQALEFMGKLLINKGDRILTTCPTYIGALQAFGLFEPQIIGISQTEDVLDMGALEAAFQQGARFFYVMPDHGNPTGTMMPLGQRHQVLELARRYAIPIIEDQAYDQLHLSGEALPSLLQLDRRSDHDTPIVSYLGTFSKSLTPGLRVGWIAAPESVIAKLSSIKQASDLNSGMLNQIIVDRLARSILVEHGPVLRNFYKDQRDRMLAALRNYMPQSTHWTTPNGGMFIWLTLPQGMDANTLQTKAFAEEKVIFVPGESFHPDGSGQNTLRLSYSQVSGDQIDDGIAKLARVIRASMA